MPREDPHVINLAFVTVFGGLLLSALLWGFKTLPKERWQMIASVPRVKNADGAWNGLNLTYYGFFSATGTTVGVALMMLLMASIGMPLLLAVGFIIVLVAICLPASRLVALIVERKRNTFTIAGAAFVATLLAPPLAWGLQQLLRNWLQLEIHLLPVLAGAVIAYAIGESIGRLACISFGCCYGIPLRQAGPTVRKLFRRYSLVLHGHTKKAAYASGLAGEPLIPVQVLTSLVFALAGLAGTVLFLAGMWKAAALIPIVCTWGWRVVSESLRADFRGSGRISSYQVMSVIALAYLVLVTSLAPSEGTPPILGLAFSRVLSLPVVAGLQAFWIALFLYYGRSRVTASTVSFHVLADQT
jgi:hypothetical protein